MGFVSATDGAILRGIVAFFRPGTMCWALFLPLTVGFLGEKWQSHLPKLDLPLIFTTKAGTLTVKGGIFRMRGFIYARFLPLKQVSRVVGENFL